MDGTREAVSGRYAVGGMRWAGLAATAYYLLLTADNTDQKMNFTLN